MTLKTEALRKSFSEMETDILLSKWTNGKLVGWAEEVLEAELLARGVSAIKLGFIKNQMRTDAASTANHTQEAGLRDIVRYVLAGIAYFIALIGQIFLVLQFAPISISGKDFDDFMLLSMGLLFVPLAIALVLLCAAFLVINLISFFFAKVCLRMFPKK